MLFAANLGRSYGQPYEFKVAAITAATEKSVPFPALLQPGPLRLRNVTLKKMIMLAYDIPGFELAVAPPWVSTDRWDVQAQADGPAIIPLDQYRQMLLRLLEARFQLRAHRETKEIEIYELVVASTGLKLRPDPWLDARGPFIKDEIGSIHLRNSSLDAFAKRLSLHLGRPVFDKTDTPGLFKFSLDWAPVPGEDGGQEVAGIPPGTPMHSANVSAPPIFKAIQEQLGLRLTPNRSPVEMIVIDKAEKPRVD